MATRHFHSHVFLLLASADEEADLTLDSCFDVCNRKRKKAGDRRADLPEADGNAEETQLCSDTVRHTHTLTPPGDSHMIAMMTPVVVSHDAAVPYGGKKKAWCWASYLEQERAIAAPSKLFKEVRRHTHTTRASVAVVKGNYL